MPRIPFNKPFITGKELDYIAQAVTLGNIGGDGYFTRECSRLMEERFGIHKVLMTPSCTAALEMAAVLCELGPGDEAIVSAGACELPVIIPTANITFKPDSSIGVNPTE